MTDPTAAIAGNLDHDGFASLLGIRLVGGSPGTVTLEMTVDDDNLNFLGGGHGGMIFAFADMAFGLASNSYGEVSVGVDAHIAYLRGVKKNDVLTAVAVEKSRNRCTAVYEVEIQRNGDLIALFTGTVMVTDRKPLAAPKKSWAVPLAF